MCAWIARGGALLALASFAQDANSWISDLKAFAEAPEASKAADLRNTLAGIKNPSMRHVVTALRSILVQAQVEPWKGPNASSAAILKYLNEAAPILVGSVDHAKGFVAACAAGGEAGRLLAMAHLEHMLESGVKPDNLDEGVKKLRLKPIG